MKKFIVVQAFMFLILISLIVLVETGVYTYNQTRIVLYVLIITNSLGSFLVLYKYRDNKEKKEN